MPEQCEQPGHAIVRRATGLECLLLMTIIVTLPLEDHIPTIAGFSFSWILFGIAALYVAFNRVAELAQVASCPAAATSYLFIIISVVVECTVASSK